MSDLRTRLKRADPNLTIPASISVAELPPGVPIIHVDEDGLAARAGIRVGDVLMALNKQPIRDTVDFYFHSPHATLTCELRDAAGGTRKVRIEKEWPEQSIGIELEQFKTQHCGCACVFCFVHQLPDSMRKSLYVKDEDYRLSFMQGSYITGATLKQADLDRIARQRLSPLYLSAHSTDEELRAWLLGIKKALPILDVLKFLKRHRLQVHTQIVLCPTHNDGAQLEKTLAHLLDLYPTVQSVAIVPLGMTKWREGLPDLPPVTPEYARQFLASLRPILRDIEQQFGEPIVLLADEWYLIAGQKAPSYSRYPDLPQLENGVGMVYHFYKDLPRARRLLKAHAEGKPWRVAALTSTLSHVVLERIIDACGTAGVVVEPVQVVNKLFGETIHVTGLLTGRDLLRAIKEHPGYDQYLLPGNCLRKYDERFLDDMTLAQLRKECGCLVSPVLGGAADFAATVLEAAGRYEKTPIAEHVFLQKHWSNT